MTKPASGDGIHYLWPTPILTKKLPDSAQLNAALIPIFTQYRQQHQTSKTRTYASSDNLLEHYKDGPVQTLGKHLSDGVFQIGAAINGTHWGRQAQDIRVEITGLWFQFSNHFGFHETHGHGNCSWSGVYYVRSADAAKPPPKGDPPNGATRFYGPNLDAMSGGYGDFGNLYLHDLSWDATPEDGKLVIFPSWLKHTALPYNGSQDRIIVSFHAQIHGSQPLRFADKYSFT